jgi:LPXTG-motif cell wall-anchored protein
VSAGALAALAAVLAFPGAADARVAPGAAPAPPEEAASAAPAPETAPASTTTTTVAPVASPEVTDAPPTVAPAAGTAPPAPDQVRAAAVTGPPSVNASPTSGLNPTGATISVNGSGFDPNANNKFGIYVVFGPVDPGTYFEDANRFLAAMWLHPGGAASGSPGQGDVRPDGTFATTLPASNGAALTATYTDGNGTPVNCLVTQCYVVTMAAHGVTDRSMDTCTPVSFAGGTATAAVDRACRPVGTPAGQPTGGGGPNTPGAPAGGGGASGSGAGSPGSGPGARSPLPRTGTEVPVLTLAGVLSVAAGLVLVGRGRRLARSDRLATAEARFPV